MNILVVDVGGSHVKVLATGQHEPRKFVSGPELTAQQMVDGVKQIAHDWEYDAVSIGYPGPVQQGRPVAEPVNLGKGWEDFDFAAAFGKSAKVINDAAMQALGSYEGGKMLFLGLGTGLGTAMVVEGRVEPMELGHLPYRKATFEDYVGEKGLERMGTKKWRRHVAAVVAMLQAALLSEYVTLGGGNIRKLKDLPPGCRLGNNENAFTGGFRLWETAPVASRGPRPTVPDGQTAGDAHAPNGKSNNSQETAVADSHATNGD
jgi:polyphosphate glucokinase